MTRCLDLVQWLVRRVARAFYFATNLVVLCAILDDIGVVPVYVVVQDAGVSLGAVGRPRPRAVRRPKAPTRDHLQAALNLVNGALRGVLSAFRLFFFSFETKQK